MSNSEIVEKLRIYLADLYSLYYKFQVFHWHVTGHHFKPLHEQFEENYTEIAVNIDDVAERVVTLGGKAPMSLSELIELSSIKHDTVLVPEEMVNLLVKDNEYIINSAKEIISIASEINDEGTNDLLAPIIRSREKANWMLKSYIK